MLNVPEQALPPHTGGVRQLQGEDGVALRQLDDPSRHRRSGATGT